MEIIEIILAFIVGLSWGLSAGLGLFPIFKQPMNIRIQTILFFIGLICFFPLIDLLFF